MASSNPTIIFTDYLAATSIVRQTTLNSSSTDKMNLRLVRASQYLSQFELDVRYKPGKQHIVPDTLSRLTSTEHAPPTQTLDDILEHGIRIQTSCYNSTMLEVSTEFRELLTKAYNTDSHWSKIKESLSDEAAPGTVFVVRDNMI